MARKRYYVYANAPSTRVGGMTCSCCGKKITQGDFRYFETSEAYVPQHRACCEGDLKWCEIDRERQAWNDRNAAMLAEATEFRDKWGVNDLDELIDSLRHEELIDSLRG